MRIVLAPDSFKGSLSAPEVCAALARGLRRALPDAEVIARPMADGGEGTLDAVLAAVGAAGRRCSAQVRGAGGAPVVADYGLVERADGTTAVIEVAQVVGITDPAGMAVPVERRSTEGVGELLRLLLDAGVRRFMVGLGGSSTNDGGSGLLSALGLALRDAAGAPVAPTPATLPAVARVDAAALDPRLRECDLRIMSDVNNPLTGARGATAIFGPQKGVGAAAIAALDAALAQFAASAEEALGRRVATQPGAGAAGGLGFALQLVGGRFASGAQVVADLIGLDAALAQADWAITGEGRSDRQTLLAKAPFVVAARAAACRVPVTLVSGGVDAASLAELAPHFAGCFGLPDGPMTLDACIAGAADLLAARAEQLARLICLTRAATRSVE